MALGQRCGQPAVSPRLVVAAKSHWVQLQSGIGMEGGPDNPLGARAMYLWSGNKDTLYRLLGTNEPWTNWHQRLVWLHPPDERGHRRSLQPHADRRADLPPGV